MKRHSGLFKQIIRFDNLLLAARKAALGKRDRPLVARFEFHLEQELFDLQEELRQGDYQPGPFFSFEIYDPKRRHICAAPFRDRVLHHAVCNVLEPHFDRRLIFDTYACRPVKGTHAAIARAQRFARRYPYFLKCDIQKYFQSIDHGVLRGMMARIFKDAELLALLGRIIEHAPPDAESGKGVPIGNLTSQHFANQYLGALDHYLKDRLRIKGYLRYMDDLLLFAEQKQTLHLWMADIRVFLQENLRLQLKEQATLLAPVSEGLPFLGFRIYPGVIRLNPRNLRRFRRQVRGLERAYHSGRLGMEEMSPSIASLFAHVAHADTLHLRRALVEDSLNLG
jgi:retron-type reverse transcriptase